MTTWPGVYGKSFKKAMIFSAAVHSLLLLLIIVNPSLPKPSSKGMIHYIPLNLVGMPGGSGGGGGGGSKAAPQTPAGAVEVKKETLRDLTPPSKLQEQPKSDLRYPVDKPKKEPKAKPEKKATITKPDTSAKTAAGETTAAAGGEKGPGGSGLTIGAGGPGYGEGSGMGLAGQIGLSSFPYVYYLQAVRDKISSRWFTSLVDTGITGTFQVAVYFRIFRNGTISTVEIRESSGIRSLDMSASRAVMTAAPFPPLPPEYDEEYLGIILIFEHSR